MDDTNKNIELKTFDFDLETQKIFDKNFSNIQKINWRKWLDISSREEYEELSLRLSGLSSVDDICIIRFASGAAIVMDRIIINPHMTRMPVIVWIPEWIAVKAE